MKQFMYRRAVPAWFRPGASKKARMTGLVLSNVAGLISLYRWYKIQELKSENAQLRAQHQGTLEVLLRDRTEEDDFLSDPFEGLV